MKFKIEILLKVISHILRHRLLINKINKYFTIIWFMSSNQQRKVKENADTVSAFLQAGMQTTS